jgi:hypothetical protein
MGYFPVIGLVMSRLTRATGNLASVFVPSEEKNGGEGGIRTPLPPRGEVAGKRGLIFQAVKIEDRGSQNTRSGKNSILASERSSMIGSGSVSDMACLVNSARSHNRGV